MNVYVESNFVLELALEQEGSEDCAEIVRLAAAGKFTLFLPAFSLAEPHQTISAKAKARSRLAGDLRAHLGELGRSRSHRDLPVAFDALATTLIQSAQLERDGLRLAISDLLDVATVIPLDSSILRSAAGAESLHGLSGQDSIVLASVLAHLDSQKPSGSCFVTKDAKDFDDPQIREKLDVFRCKLFGSFKGALGFLHDFLRRAE